MRRRLRLGHRKDRDIGMLCSRCEALSASGGRRGASSLARVWGVERLANLLCASCGAILTPEDLVQRLLQKQSQLAQFGLVDLWQPMMDAFARETH